MALENILTSELTEVKMQDSRRKPQFYYILVLHTDRITTRLPSRFHVHYNADNSDNSMTAQVNSQNRLMP
jgi:hypothetical protein